MSEWIAEREKELWRLLTAGLHSLRKTEECLHHVDHKSNMAESFFWMGVCAILLLVFGLPEKMKLAVKTSRQASLQYQQQGAAVVSRRRLLDVIVAGSCLVLAGCMVVDEWQRKTLARLIQFPFCLLVTHFGVLLGHQFLSVRHYAITASVLLLPSVPTAVFSLLMSDSLQPQLFSPEQSRALTAMTALALAAVPGYIVVGCDYAALRVSAKIPMLSGVLGWWYALQVRWTVVLGLALFTHGNLELMLCPTPALRALLAPLSPALASSSLPLYRSVLTLLMWPLGWLYTEAIVRVATMHAKRKVRAAKAAKGK